MDPIRILKASLSFAIATVFATFFAGCDEKQSIDQPTNVKAVGEEEEDLEEPGTSRRTSKSTSTKTGTDLDKIPSPDDASAPPFSICQDGLKAHPDLKGFATQVKILCDDGKLISVLSSANVFTGGERKLFEQDKKLGDLQTSFKIYSGGSYESLPEDYWHLLKLQFIKPKVFRDNYLDDPNAKMDLVNPSGDTVTYRYTNNSGEGGVIEYDAKTIFVTLKTGKAWVAATQKVGPTRETMESLQSLQVVFESDGLPGKTALVSISDQVYKHASGQGQSYYDRAMNNLTTEQKNGYTNAKTSQKAKALLGP